MEYTYITLTPEQAIRITRYVSIHATDIIRCRAVVKIAGVSFEKAISTSLLKSYKGFFEDFIQGLRAVGRDGAIMLQISKDDTKKIFSFYEKI